MPVVDNIIGIVRGINDRKQAHQVDEQLKNYLNAPDETIQNVMKIDPRIGMKLRDDETARTTAADTQRRTRLKENTDTIARYLRGAPEGSDYGAILDQQAPLLKSSLGISDEEIANFKQGLGASPGILSGLDDEAYKAVSKDRYSDTVATPGAYVRRGGKTVERVPYAPKAVVVRGGDGSSQMQLFNPNEYLGGGDGAENDTVQDDNAATPQDAAPGDMTAAPEQMAIGVIDRVEKGRQTAPKGVQSVTQSEARAMQQAWGGGAAGKQRFAGWAASRGVRVVPDNSRGAPAGDLPVQQVQTAPTMRAQRSGEPIGAASAPKPQKQVRAASPEELQQAGYPKGTAGQINQDGQFVNLKTPPASSQDSAAIRYKREKDAEAFVNKARGVDASFGRLEGAAKRLLNHPGMEPATGALDSMLPNLLVGQEGTNFRNELETLRNNIGLSILQDFKAQSSQGASGFGNLSNAEGDRLERAFGTLAESNDPATIKRTLRTIIEIAGQKRKVAQETLERGGPPTTGGSTIATGTVARNKNGAELVWNGTQWVRKGNKK